MVKINTMVGVSIGIVTCILVLLYIMMALHPLEQKKPATVYTSYSTSFGNLFLATNLSDQPQIITLYRVIPQKYDMVYYVNGDPINIGNISSENEASHVALKILDQYGGLPEGAGPLEAHTEYIEHFNGTNSWEPSELIPDSVVINCQRSLDGKPVIGGYIRMELGFNNELLSLRKVWRTVTPAGTMEVISPKDALQKILRGEVLNGPMKCPCDVTVDKIILTYKENGYNETQDHLEPVWDFKGTLSDGDSFSYLVSAESTPATSSHSRVTRDYLITEIPPDELPPDNIHETDNNPNTTGNALDNQSNTLPKGNHS